MTDEPRGDLLDRLALRTVGHGPASARPRGWRIGISRRQAIGGGARAAAALTVMGSLRLSLAEPAAAQRQSCIPCLEEAYKKSQRDYQRCRGIRDKIDQLREREEVAADLIDRLYNKYKRRPTKKNLRALNRAREVLQDVWRRGGGTELHEQWIKCYENVEYQLKLDRYKCVGLPTTAQAGGGGGCNEQGAPAGSVGGPGGSSGQVNDPCGCVGSDICCSCIHTDPPGFICCIAPYACQCCPGGA